jgi:hypothetical protein
MTKQNNAEGSFIDRYTMISAGQSFPWTHDAMRSSASLRNPNEAIKLKKKMPSQTIKSG